MSLKSLIINAIFVSAFVLQSEGNATFKNWQSDAFEPKHEQKESFQRKDLENNLSEPEKRELKEQAETYRSRAEDEDAYYEAIAPKDMERDHDYLLKDHPLQEAPLPDKPVE